MPEFYYFINTNTICTQSIFFAVQLGIGIGGYDGQLGCSFHNGFAILWGDSVSNFSTVRFVAHQQHFKLLDLVDQTSESHWTACALLLGIKIWSLNLLHILLSMPVGFRQFCLILIYWFDWCLMNFLIIFGFMRGLRAAKDDGCHLQRQ